MLDHPTTIRAATPSDAGGLARLAALAGRSRIRGNALLAERAGVTVAAIALTSGSAVAHPSHASAEALDLLKRRRYQLLRQGGEVAPLRALVRRVATR